MKLPYLTVSVFVVSLMPFGPVQAQEEDLRERVERLEKEVAQLKARLNETPPKRDVEVDGTPIRCEVSLPGTREVRVRSIVPAGKRVKRGEVLVEFAADALEEALSAQKIQLATAEANLIQSQTERDHTIRIAQTRQAQAEADVNAAEVTVKEYLEGRRAVEAKELEAAVRQAELTLANAQRLVAAEKADKFVVETAKTELEVAKLRNDVYQKFTVPKVTQELQADVVAAKARLETAVHEQEQQIKSSDAQLKAQKKLYEIARNRRDRMLQQLELCRVVAPHDGVVVPLPGAPRIGEGSSARKGQVLLLLQRDGD